MRDDSDMELVRSYVAYESELAFETLVTRYVNLVYSAALRQVCDPHLAEEVTQAVFIILARKVGSFGPNTILPSWLHRTAGFVARDALKTRYRRAQREQEAYMQSPSNESQPDADETWAQIAPLLDTAIADLAEKDRHAIVLRFFENKSLHEVGRALGATEDTARMRVTRAVEKLRRFFVKRGVASTTTIIAGLISTNSVQAAPVALATSITAAGVAKGAAVSGSTTTLVKGALKLMAWTKAKTAVLVGAAVVLTLGTATVTIVKSRSGQGPFGVAQLREQVNAMRAVLPAIAEFAGAHQDQLPVNVAQLKPYLPSNLAGMDDEHWEMVASGKLTPLMKQPGLEGIILLRQKNIPPNQARIIVYADGSIAYKKQD